MIFLSIHNYAKFLDGADRDDIDSLQMFTGVALICCLLATIMSVVGLEEFRDRSLVVRFPLWFFHLLPALIPISFVTRYLRRYGLSSMKAAFIALIVCLPLVGSISLAVDSTVESGNLGSVSLIYLLYDEVVSVAPIAFVIWVSTAGLLFDKALTIKTGETGKQEQAEPSEVEDVLDPLDIWPASLSHVEDKYRGEIIYLSADQHYVRVSTVHGESYVRAVFSSVIKDLSSVNGWQIHRSHWVAQNHVNSLEMLDGNLHVVTDTGIRLPVSRRRKSEVRKLFSQATASPQVSSAHL